MTTGLGRNQRQTPTDNKAAFGASPYVIRARSRFKKTLFFGLWYSNYDAVYYFRWSDPQKNQTRGCQRFLGVFGNHLQENLGCLASLFLPWFFCSKTRRDRIKLRSFNYLSILLTTLRLRVHGNFAIVVIDTLSSMVCTDVVLSSVIIITQDESCLC